MVVATTQQQELANYSHLAANASHISRKRSRILFCGIGSANNNNNSNNNNNNLEEEDDEEQQERNAIHALVPPEDVSIHRSSLARRIRSSYEYGGITNTNSGFDTVLVSSSSSAMRNLTRNSLISLEEERSERLRRGEECGKGCTSTEEEKTATTTTSTTDIVVLHDMEGNNDGRMMQISKLNMKVKQPLAVDAIIPKSMKKATNTTSKLMNDNNDGDGILVRSGRNGNNNSNNDDRRPKWHAPWRLSTVLSSHLGWVRSIAFDPTNDMFATGAADRTIKIFDFAKSCAGSEDALKITLTGHISPIRGLEFSDRHPYLFSAGEDKMVKCWDLETNQVVRHYHGHLSGVFCLGLHPTLDVLITGGRDAVARVWDMRTRHQVHCLSGHDNTVGALLVRSSDPQIITGSHDSTIKTWDLAAGKCMTTLTHHKKAVRSLVHSKVDNTFVSVAADGIRAWGSRDGRFLRNFHHQGRSGVAGGGATSAVVNALDVNEDGVLTAGRDDGTIEYYDYNSGHMFQTLDTIAQPGSLDAERGIYVSKFDHTGSRLITGEADKTIKIWKEDPKASEGTHPVDLKRWKKDIMSERKKKY